MPASARASSPQAYSPFQMAGHAHFKGSRTGKAAAAQHITGRVCIKAAHRFACRAEALGNAADQAGRVGALPFLRPLCHGQVDHIQLVESAGFDPHVAVCIVRSHGHKIQRDRRRQPITMLVVGVVAAQLRTPRGRINLHLPPGPKYSSNCSSAAQYRAPAADRSPGPHRRKVRQGLSSHLPAAICSLSCALVAIRDSSLNIQTLFVGLLRLL